VSEFTPDEVAWIQEHLDPEVMDQVSAADREWFEEHPDQHCYWREFVPGELPPLQPPRWSGRLVLMVEVRQLAPGVRQRQLYVVAGADSRLDRPREPPAA